MESPEYSSVKVVVEDSTSITTFTANKVRQVERHENFDPNLASDGFMLRSLGSILESVTFKIHPEEDPITRQCYQEVRVDKTLHPERATRGAVPLYIPVGPDGETQHVLGMIDIEGDTATIKLSGGETFESLLASGSIFLGMQVLFGPARSADA